MGNWLFGPRLPSCATAHSFLYRGMGLVDGVVPGGSYWDWVHELVDKLPAAPPHLDDLPKKGPTGSDAEHCRVLGVAWMMLWFEICKRLLVLLSWLACIFLLAVAAMLGVASLLVWYRYCIVRPPWAVASEVRPSQWDDGGLGSVNIFSWSSSWQDEAQKLKGVLPRKLQNPRTPSVFKFARPRVCAGKYVVALCSTE